jgi:hypothetical protein
MVIAVSKIVVAMIAILDNLRVAMSLPPGNDASKPPEHPDRSYAKRSSFESRQAGKLETQPTLRLPIDLRSAANARGQDRVPRQERMSRHSCLVII